MDAHGATMGTMVVNKEVIQAIRLKRTAQQTEELIAKGNALARELLEISGLVERGLDPRGLRLSPEQLALLLERAQAIEAEMLLDETVTRRSDRGRTSV
jgi:hypothetical protein